MKKYPAIFILLLIIISCNRHEGIYDEVMEIHDESMAKMDQIMVLKADLNKKIEFLQEDSLVDNSQQIDDINELILSLEEADEGMMNWMREFHDEYENVAKSEIMDYLEEQKEKITNVGKRMNEAIENAQQYLNANA